MRINSLNLAFKNPLLKKVDQNGVTGALPPWRAKKYKRGLRGLCPRV